MGGGASVRGYDEFVITGDRGAVLRNELRFPSIPVIGDGVDRFQVLAFLDAGYVSSAETLPGETSTSLSSIGIGLRYALGSYLQFRADYGEPLDNPPTGRGSGRLHLNLSFAW